MTWCVRSHVKLMVNVWRVAHDNHENENENENEEYGFSKRN